MKRTYRFHPPNYDVGRMEQFYARMAAKGWILDKRGVYLSRFRRSKPQELVCRIELSGAEGMPQEQMALYEEAGWQLAARLQFVNVFFAPKGSGAPEFYSDPAQQGATYTALRRSYRNSFLSVLGYTVFYILLVFLGSYQGSPLRFMAAVRIAFLTNTLGMCAILLFLLLCWYQQLRAVVCLHTVCRRLKAGIPFDHDRSLLAPLGWIGWFLAACFVILAAFSVWEYTSSRPQAMPQSADGPYLTLSDLGYEGERTWVLRHENESEVAHGVTPLASWWDTQEFVKIHSDSQAALYQKVFEVSDPAMARPLAFDLMETSTFHREFTSVQADGFDGVWQNDLELVAVKGCTVYSITYILPDSGPSAVIEALSRRSDGAQPAQR